MFWSPESIRPSLAPRAPCPPMFFCFSTISTFSSGFNRPEVEMQARLGNIRLGLAEAQFDGSFVRLDRINRLEKPEGDERKTQSGPRSPGCRRNRPEAPGANDPDRGGVCLRGPGGFRPRPLAAFDPKGHRRHYCYRRHPMGRRRRSDYSRAFLPLNLNEKRHPVASSR